MNHWPSQWFSGYKKGLVTLTRPYVHCVFSEEKFHNAVLSNTLQLVWDEVDGAERYEAEITKADGSSKIYAADTPCLLIKAGSDDFITGCPKVYVAETSTWTAATVRVRALAGDDVSNWSETAKISCNALFHTK